MGISVNGPSGIDTSYIIDSLTDLERNKVRTVEKERKAYQVKIDAYSKLKSFLLEIKSKAANLSKLSSFDLFSTTTSNDKLATIRGGTGAVDGQFSLKVFQTASSEKMISKTGMITSQTASLSSLGVGVGDISIDGVQITIDGDDTIQDLRQKINVATDASGKRIGVTASVLKVTDTDYRMVLTSKATGSTGTEYKDISGSALQDLGIITSAAGEKGTTKQQLLSAGDVVTDFNALAVGGTIQIAGTDREGNATAASFVKTATSTIDDFLAAVKGAYHDMVDVSTDVSGSLVVSDKVGGTSKLSMSSLTIGAAVHTVGVGTLGSQGAGVLSVGKDAYFSVEGISMTSATNSASGFVTGVTFDLHAANPDETVTVGMNRDLEGIQKKFQELIDTYNALVRFARESTSMGNMDTEDEDDRGEGRGDLAGDMTINTMVSQVRNAFRQQFELFGGSFTNFTMVGVKTDPQNGEMQLDGDKFKAALEKGFDEVVRLFTTVGVSDNANVAFGKSTATTRSGKYTLEEVDGTYMRVQLEGDSTWYTSNARLGDIVQFSDGPVAGLSLNAAAGSIGVGNSATFTFSKGFAEILDGAIDKLTDSREGLITMRQESWRRSISSADSRIDRLEDRVEKFRLRLVRQFADMERAMSDMQSQSSQMMSSLGFYSQK